MPTQDDRETDAASPTRRTLRVIAVTSGKGGVGKTNLSVNLGVTFARQGRQVLIVDGDLGLANVDILLDETPTRTLADVLAGRCEVRDVLVRSERYGVTVLPGTSGVAEVADLTEDDRMRLLRGVSELDERQFDTVLVDTGAGIGSNSLFFAAAAAEVLVVTTPEPTALADAYAVIKVLSKRHRVERVGLVLNHTRDQEEARDVYFRLSELTARFLPVVLEFVGFVPLDPHVPEAVKAQRPVVDLYPAARASRAIVEIADNVLMRPAPSGASGRLQLFWERLVQGTGGDMSAPPIVGV